MYSPIQDKTKAQKALSQAYASRNNPEKMKKALREWKKLSDSSYTLSFLEELLSSLVGFDETNDRKKHSYSQ